MRRPVEDRFWAKVALPDGNGCLLWLAAKAGGYGRFLGRHGRVTGAHQFAYEMAHGPIPPGYDVDHLCRQKACVAPRHLEAVPHLENVRRGTASAVQKARHAARTSCKDGHAFTTENTRINRAGARICRICERAYQRRWRARRRSA